MLLYNEHVSILLVLNQSIKCSSTMYFILDHVKTGESEINYLLAEMTALFRFLLCYVNSFIKIIER